MVQLLYFSKQKLRDPSTYMEYLTTDKSYMHINVSLTLQHATMHPYLPFTTFYHMPIFRSYRRPII